MPCSFVYADTATTSVPVAAAPVAPNADVLQNQIDQSAQQINQLKQEIEQLQGQLDTTSKQKQTLQGAVKSLDLNIKKLATSITLTNVQITQKDREIKRLSGNISTTTNEIGQVQQEVGRSLNELGMLDAQSPVFLLLSNSTLSSFFDEATTLASVRISLGEKIKKLTALKAGLQVSKTSAVGKRQDLVGLQQNLAQQKQSLAIARQTQADLLVSTKNKESVYQAQIAQKKAQEAQFEQDLLNFEAQLDLKVLAGSVPSSGSGVLQWPLSRIIITQYFGNTPFATANAQLYNGHGHTGVDFGASPGTPVKAARGGVILGTGNTDATCPGASYGKWVFIKHDNGLSTLYAHLSVISVSKGQSVSVGQVVGYSGSTGYATGPHLHFGVYASSGSEVASFASKSCNGKTYTMPVGDISAYLNPLSYLPHL
ncbi:MAG: peptidoglycan DD-metalloendopeptidase family protein [bacterium]